MRNLGLGLDVVAGRAYMFETDRVVIQWSCIIKSHILSSSDQAKLSCFSASSTILSSLSWQCIAGMSATSGASRSVLTFRQKRLSRGRKAGKKVPTTFLLNSEWWLMYPFSSLSGRDAAIPRESDVHAKAATSHIASRQINGVFILSRAKPLCRTRCFQVWLASAGAGLLFPAGMCQITVFEGWSCSLQQTLKALLMEHNA